MNRAGALGEGWFFPSSLPGRRAALVQGRTMGWDPSEASPRVEAWTEFRTESGSRTKHPEARGRGQCMSS